MRKLSLAVFVVLFAISQVFCFSSTSYGAGESAGKVVVGSKNFTEQMVVGHMVAELIEAVLPPHIGDTAQIKR